MIFVISLAESFALKLDKTICPEIFLLFKLGKSKGVLKYICLSFVSFLPLFYFCYIYYFDLLIFCCRFVAISL